MEKVIKNKVSNVKITDRPCETSRGFSFSLKINNIEANGFFASVAGACMSSMGVDCNQLEVVIGGKKTCVKIATSSGYRFYELALHTGDFTKNPKQKDFRFTGAYYLITPLQNKIKVKVLALLSNPKVEFTEEFKAAFKI